MSTEPVLDIENALKAMGDDREIYEEVLKTYLEATPELFRTIVTAVRGGDRETLKRQAHSLKSSSFTIGARQLGATGLDLETLTDTMDDTTAFAKIETAKTQYNELCKALAEQGFSI
jgi:HPt (histidine-containing phosphotransfer) domain-containing protein